MKIRILSDIHLEFWNWQYNNCGEDVVFIAGDICPRSTYHAKPMLDLFKQINVPVFFCLGNHDFYGDLIDGTIEKITAELKKKEYQHIHFLNNSFVDFCGYRICGTPGWTDFSSVGAGVWQEEAILESRLYISDFKHIKNTSPEDYILREKLATEFLKYQAQNSEKPLIFISHWVPSNKFISEKYKGEILNGYFINDCAEKIVTDKVKLWQFGHTHSNWESQINNTKFICNPRGYPGENKDWIENLIVEI